MQAVGDQVHGDVASALASTALSLARCFGAGATLWCWAPESPHHAQHVAVEFVHPVVMGARALDAVALTVPDPTAGLRSSATVGDVLLVIAPGDTVADVVRQARSTGLTTIWMGWGPGPPAGVADHVVWFDSPTADVEGQMVVGYHVLWELTHVCLDHLGASIPTVTR